MTENFESLLTETIGRCLIEMIGTHAAQAMNFYLDPNLAAKDPNAYASKLKAIAGEKPTKVILARIEKKLCEKVGIAEQDWPSLDQCLTQVKEAFALRS